MQCRDQMGQRSSQRYVVNLRDIYGYDGQRQARQLELPVPRGPVGPQGILYAKVRRDCTLSCYCAWLIYWGCRLRAQTAPNLNRGNCMKGKSLLGARLFFAALVFGISHGLSVAAT